MKRTVSPPRGPVTDQERGLLIKWMSKPCRYCKRELRLAKYVSIDGSVGFYWYCTNCQREGHPAGVWIPQKVVQLWVQYGKVRPDELKHRPFHSNYPCEVCGESAFPVNIIRNKLPGWPSVNLCSIHYRQWLHALGDSDLYDCDAAITTYAPFTVELLSEGES